MRFDKRSKLVAYLNDKDPKSIGYRDAISWMKASPISYAVSKDLIRAIVMGEEIVLTVDSIARMLRMERDVGSLVMLSLEDVHEGFLEMGYKGTEFLERREIKKSFLTKE
ncbi:hypothetical protein QVD17_16786 [Tagetes erecta]|uniref:Uncharacterized protein n=1 Tax=Tagetes erecta TaxID=13708 RepID=A0AAD8KVM9_TARER|nr:hypothetical protein QVD17_16786 [Tagetes erecta]